MGDKEYELTIKSESDDSEATIMYNLPFEQAVTCDEPIYLGVYSDDRNKSIGLTLEQAEDIARGLLHMINQIKEKQDKAIPKEERELYITYLSHLENERYRQVNMFHALTYNSLMYKMEGLDEQSDQYRERSFEAMLEVVTIDKKIDDLVTEIGYDYKVKLTTEEA